MKTFFVLHIALRTILKATWSNHAVSETRQMEIPDQSQTCALKHIVHRYYWIPHCKHHTLLLIIRLISLQKHYVSYCVKSAEAQNIFEIYEGLWTQILLNTTLIFSIAVLLNTHIILALTYPARSYDSLERFMARTQRMFIFLGEPLLR